MQWRHFGLDEATWEMEDAMRQAYPILFNFVHTIDVKDKNIEDDVPLRGRELQHPVSLVCKNNYTGQELWKTQKCECVM